MQTNPNKYRNLRQRAEELLSQKENFDLPKYLDSMEKILEELSIFQIELELQNEELERTNDQLSRVSQQYQELYNEAPVGYFTLNRTGNILQINQTGANMLGTTPQALKNSSFIALIEKDWRPVFVKHIKRCMEIPQTQRCELRVNSWDGHSYFLQLESVVFYHEESQQKLCRVTASDISYQKQVEDIYKSLIENPLQGIVIVKNDQVLFTNERVEAISGYSLKELKKLMPEAESLIHPQDLDRLSQRLGKSMKGNLLGETLSLRVKHQKGHYFWIEAFSALIDYHGEPAMLYSFSDITELQKAKDELHQNKLFLDTIIDHLPIGMQIFDHRGVSMRLNDKHCKLLGLPDKNTGIGKFNVLTDPYSVANKAAQVYKKAYAGHTILNREHQYNFDIKENQWQTTQGKKYFRESIFPIFDHDQSVKAVVALLEDISDWKNAEEALRQSQQMLDMFFSQSLDGFFFMMLDKPVEWNDQIDKNAVLDYAFENQHFTKINQALLNQYGARREEFMKLTPADFFEHNIAYGKEVWRKLFDHGKLHIETEERKFNGEVIYVEGDYICLYTSDGKIRGHFGVQRDVTQQKITQQWIKENEERWNFAFTAIGDGVWDWNLKTNEVFYSETWAKMLGYSPNEISNSIEIWEKLIHPADLETTHQKVQQHIKGETDFYESEHRLLCKDGSYKWILDRGKIVEHDTDGAPRRFVGTHTDISERRKSQRRLKELNAAKNRFFSIISHDLRSPFNSLLGFSEMAIKEDLDAQTSKKISENIYKASQSAYNLLENLLQWGRTQMENFEAKPIVFDFKKLIERSFDTLQTVAEQKKISMFTSVLGTINVFADPDMIETVLRNLLSNAIKFTAYGGQIYVDSHQKGDMLEFSVSDTGIGMKEAELSKLFRLEEKISKPGTADERGTGLGLLISKEMVEKNGGKIWVESKYGQGSTFFFTIPRTEKKLPRP